MCQHFFHPECIEKWFQSKYSKKRLDSKIKCPLCNTEVDIEALLRCKKEREEREAQEKAEVLIEDKFNEIIQDDENPPDTYVNQVRPRPTGDPDK